MQLEPTSVAIAIPGGDRLPCGMEALVMAVLSRYPAIADRCDPEQIAARLEEWGIHDEGMLGAVMAGDPLAATGLRKAIGDAAPPSFLGLAASHAAEQREHPGQELPSLDEDSGAGLPNSFLRRFLLSVPPWEMFIPKDHFPNFKQHWIESWRHDPSALRDAFLMLFQTELVFGALLLGVVITIYFDNLDDTMVADFQDFQVNSTGFWIVVMGTLSCILSFMIPVVCYMMIMLIMPIHSTNIYHFLILPSTTRTLVLPDVLLVCDWGTSTLMLGLILMKTSTALNLVLVVGTFAFAYVSVFFTMGYSFNAALVGGFFSQAPVLQEEPGEELSPAGTEDRVLRPMLRYRKQRGILADPPARGFYPAPGARRRAPAGHSQHQKLMQGAVLRHVTSFGVG